MMFRITMVIDTPLLRSATRSRAAYRHGSSNFTSTSGYGRFGFGLMRSYTRGTKARDDSTSRGGVGPSIDPLRVL